MTGTSAATPQVAGVAALLLSEMNTGSHPNIDGPLAPEDVQGLLSVTALDMNFTVVGGSFDTTGYDAKTGYGLIKTDQALAALMNPYELRHYSSTGGTIHSTELINPFIVLQPTHGEALLAPSVQPNHYVANRHLVRKIVSLSGWEMARSWGRGGDGTVGWNGAQPSDASNNSKNYQTGYTRVVGDAPVNEPAFNYGNIRDISHRNDQITLETFIYEVYDGNTVEFIGWYPATAENVVYRYSVWGEPTTPSVVRGTGDAVRGNGLENLRCQVQSVVGRSRATISFGSMQPGPVDITVYDALGRPVQNERRDYWSSEAEQSFGFDVEELPSGIYFVVVRSGGAMGTCRMEVVR